MPIVFLLGGCLVLALTSAGSQAQEQRFSCTPKLKERIARVRSQLQLAEKCGEIQFRRECIGPYIDVAEEEFKEAFPRYAVHHPFLDSLEATRGCMVSARAWREYADCEREALHLSLATLDRFDLGMEYVVNETCTLSADQALEQEEISVCTERIQKQVNLLKAPLQALDSCFWEPCDDPMYGVDPVTHEWIKSKKKRERTPLVCLTASYTLPCSQSLIQAEADLAGQSEMFKKDYPQIIFRLKGFENIEPYGQTSQLLSKDPVRTARANVFQVIDFAAEAKIKACRPH